jgi:hypothetical protein
MVDGDEHDLMVPMVLGQTERGNDSQEERERLRKRHWSEGRSAPSSRRGAVRGGSLAGADDGEGRERGRSEDGQLGGKRKDRVLSGTRASLCG